MPVVRPKLTLKVRRPPESSLCRGIASTNGEIRFRNDSTIDVAAFVPTEDLGTVIGTAVEDVALGHPCTVKLNGTVMHYTPQKIDYNYEANGMKTLTIHGLISP